MPLSEMTLGRFEGFFSGDKEDRSETGDSWCNSGKKMGAISNDDEESFEPFRVGDWFAESGMGGTGGTLLGLAAGVEGVGRRRWERRIEPVGLADDDV
jgi:hypothetical protein